jgi:DNA-binding SARP family transcriptional activator/tetratricopeptide (TPR) repeat protein
MAIRVETLGDVRILVDGREVPDLPGQPIRCGLLVYLAIERQARRDPLIMMFWPEKEPARAKHSLSQTLYELAGVLDSESWLDRRVERISVSDEVGTDARDFEAALSGERWDEALRLYRGPFLEGHHLAPTTDFEHWTEQVRTRLDRGFETASAKRVAHLLDKGSAEEALPIARRWVASSQLSEGAELALIETLARAGRGVEAIQEFNEYQARVAEELGTEPPRRMLELVDHIKSGRLAVAAPPAAQDTRRRGDAIGRRTTGVIRDSDFTTAQFRVGDVYQKLRARSQLATFHGREAELSLLHSAVDSALEGVGSLVTISGPAGIGKTSLFLKLREGLDPRAVSVHQTRCQPHRFGAPFVPLTAVLRDALGVPEGLSAGSTEALQRSLRSLDPALADDPAVRAHLLGLEPGEPSSERPQDELLRAAVENSLFRIVQSLTRERPRVCFLDDWQWSDEASHEAVLGLARRIAELPIVLIVGARSFQRNAWRDVRRTEIELEPLASPEIEGLVASLLGVERLHPDLLATLGNATGGNPFHIEEACRALQEGGALAEGSGPTRMRSTVGFGVPASVDDMLLSRIGRLERPDAEALQLAAVLGAQISVQLLTQIADFPDALPSALKRLEALHLIRAVPSAEQPAFEFRHDLTLDAAKSAVPRDRSKELHRKAAEALEELHADSGLDSVVEEIAFHYAESGDTAKAPLYLEKAGDKARRSFSLADARKHYRRAIELLDASGSFDERRIDLSFKLADASIQAASSELLPLLDRSRKKALELRDKPRHARTLYWLGWTHYALGNQLDAKQYLRDCLELLLSQNDERLLAQVYLNIGYSYAASTEYDEAVEYFRRGRQRRPIGAGKHSQGLAYTLGYEAMIHGDQGNFEKAHERLREGLELVEVLGRRSIEGSVRTQNAMVLFFQGDWDGCKRVAAQIRQIGTEIGSHYIDAISRTIDGYARFLTGDESGIEALREAVRGMDASGALLIMSWNCACLAEALALAGEHEEARRFANRALERGTFHDWLGEPAAHRALARVSAGAKQPDWAELEEHVDAALARSAKKGSKREAAITHLTAAQLFAEHGRADEARRHLVKAEPRFRRMGMSWYLDAASALANELE